MLEQKSEIRFKIQLQEPNPQFIKWLERLLKEAEMRNSKSQNKIRQAIESLRSYPLPLYSGRECAILRGFGSKLCSFIDGELKLHQSGAHLQEVQSAAIKNNESYQEEVQQVLRSVKKVILKPKSQTATAKPKKLTKKAQQAFELEERKQRAVTMHPREFRIKLLVDTQEVKGKNKRILDQTRSYLESLGIEHEVRRLTIGDFLWIAQDSDGNELVLPYIVERKRMDDLASSIRDGRFHEQKHRLRICGIPNIIYLCEDYNDNEHLGLPLESLLQGMSNTQIQAGFTTMRTKNHYRSMVYLQCMTRTLIKLYQDKTLINTTKASLETCEIDSHTAKLLKFQELYDDSSRNAQLTVREVFVQQLVQLHSLSLEKAVTLVEHYPTPRCLLDAYDSCISEVEAKCLLKNIKCGQMQRPLGEKISKCLYEFYRTNFNYRDIK